MIEYVGYMYVFILLICWTYFIFKDTTKALIFVIYSSIIYVSYFSKINIDFIIKLIFFINCILCFLKYKTKRKFGIYIFLFLLFFINGMLGASFTNTYSFFDNLTAFLTIFTGFLALLIDFPIENKKYVLKKISYIPLVSVALGILLLPFNLIPFFSRSESLGLGGVSLATNLSFLCFCAIISSMSYYYLFNNVKFRYIAYINLGITILTLTRGGILAGVIVLFPDIIQWIRESIKYRKKFLISVILLIILTAPLLQFMNILYDRTFVNGKFNSSGRIDAWRYIINLVDDKFTGNGLGNLKTLTDGNLRSFTAAHNEYIRTFYEMGYLGLILSFIILKRLFKINNPHLTQNYFYYFCIIGFAMYSFTDNTIMNFRCWFPFVTVISIIGSMKHEEKI